MKTYKFLVVVTDGRFKTFHDIDLDTNDPMLAQEKGLALASTDSLRNHNALRGKTLWVDRCIAQAQNAE